ncbi:MAG: hypothetical protein IPI73_30280 [Betaproteobacteria bacterium]|nr:hypothetical protein [Betaproteobacteria bacterium]
MLDVIGRLRWLGLRGVEGVVGGALALLWWYASDFRKLQQLEITTIQAAMMVGFSQWGTTYTTPKPMRYATPSEVRNLQLRLTRLQDEKSDQSESRNCRDDDEVFIHLRPQCRFAKNAIRNELGVSGDSQAKVKVWRYGLSIFGGAPSHGLVWD